MTRPRAAVAAASLVAGVTLALASPAVGAVTDIFELDGNVLDNTATAPPDWGAASGTNSIFTTASAPSSTVVGVPRSPLPTNFFDAGFARDFIPGSTSDTTTYTVGSKDQSDVAGWTCKTANNVTDKGDIQNAYAAVANDPSNQHLVLYFGMEKNSSNGDNNMGVWFLQDSNVACNGASGNTPFSGHHVDGDIFLVAAFTNGGGCSLINAYSWKGGANGALSAPVVASPTCGGSATLTAVTNGATVTTPWTTVDKVLGQGTQLGADQFYEGAVDLTANHLDKDSSGNPICTNKFIFDTRSSQQTSATLYDYAEGNVHTCFPTSITTLLKKDNLPAGPGAEDTSLPATPASAHTVTLPASVYDTSNLTAAAPDPTGTLTYSLWTDSDCTAAATGPLFGTGTNVAAPVTVGSPSPALTFTLPGDFWWKVVYTPSAASRNTGSESACSTEPLTVVKPKPTIATTPSATSIVIGNGHSFSDTATVSGGYFPSGGIAPGTVTFTLYGPFASSAAITATSCTSPLTQAGFTNPADRNASRVSDSTATATSGTLTPTAVGVYQWIAKYNGNAQNQASDPSACGDTTEQVTVQPVTPSLATTILLSDKVKVTGVTGAGAIAGNVTFTLYPTTDCSGSAVTGGTFGPMAIDANGLAQTTTPVAVAAGSYSWKVDFAPSSPTNYTTASTTCTPAQSDEQATISYAGGSPIS